MKFEIILKYRDGRIARLSHRDKTEWEKRTAKQHLRDVQAKIANGEWPDVRCATLLPV